MSGPIQVIPPGLLGFFQLKVNGRNPVDLAESVAPVLPMRDWYFEANALDWMQARGGGAPPGISIASANCGFKVFSPLAVQVPPNEIWWVQNYTVRASNFAANDQVMFRVAYRRPLLGTLNEYDLPDGEGPSVNFLAADASDRYISSAKGFWVPPGSELGFNLMSHIRAAGTTSFTASIRFTPLSL